MVATLEQSELVRYSRHLILPDVGVVGQEKLKAARVLLIGAGGLGSPVALYLAAAGVGTLGLVDFDNVDVTNLQRQILHGTKDVGRPKLVSARERIADVNPHVRLETYETALTSKNALDISSSYDIVVDGTDNFATRYLVNDACVLLGKPNVTAAYSDSKARHRSSHCPTVPAIAVSSRNRRRRDSCQAAPRAVCWACCRVSWGRFRRPRQLS